MFFYNKLICPNKARWTHYPKIYQVFVMGILIIYSVKFCFGSANFAKVKTERACGCMWTLKLGWNLAEDKTKLTIPALR